MRDLLILLVVGAGALYALRRPWIGTLLWTWISVMNPHRYAWGIAYTAPVAAIAAGATLVGLVFTKERQSPFKGAAVWWLLIFFVWVTLSWKLGIDPEAEHDRWDRVMKIYLMIFVTLSLLRTKQQILAFTWVTVGSIAVLATKGGLFTIMNGGDYRVFGPPESFIADNNDFALATIIIIPMLHFLQMQLKRPWMRHGMTVVTLSCVASVLGSHSRGGLLALIAMGGILWLRSSRKGLFVVLGIIGAIVLLPIMPQDWWERMGTIGTYTQDESAMGRINAWYVAVDTAQQYFFGAGMSYQYQALFDEFGRWETIVRAAHSIYFQILGNHGFVGLFLFLMIWVSAYRSASWLSRHAEQHPEAQWAVQLGRMASASIAGYAVGGAFLSLPYFDLPYNILIVIVLARKWVETRAWEKEQAAPATTPAVPAATPGSGLKPVGGSLRGLRRQAGTPPPQGH